MLLTITNTKDLGFLLHKNPSRVQSFELSSGKAHVFYPEATNDRCTAALLLDVDSVGLVRTRRGPLGECGMLHQYVNDRPYVASSFMSVAIARIFNSALAGCSKDRPELVSTPLPLAARIAVLPCRGGEAFLRSLFEPLGYRVTAEHHPLDDNFPEWGKSSYYTVGVAKEVTLQDLLTRQMETYCYEQPGTFCFSRPIYADGSSLPRWLEFGLLKTEQTLWVKVFDN
jgi:3' terminal RNA ribose 2'-O-methyltransferase Hen1